MTVATSTSDWRDVLRDATDLALLGIGVTVAAAPVLTAGAALAVASRAVHLRFTDGRWPGPGELGREFVRRLLPGAVATLTVLAAALLLAANLFWLRDGTVPGGGMLRGVTVAVGVGLGGLLSLSIPQLGRGYAYRTSVRAALAHPRLIAAAAGILLLAVLLGAILPVTIPLLVGYVMFALYVTARRSG